MFRAFRIRGVFIYMSAVLLTTVVFSACRKKEDEVKPQPVINQPVLPDDNDHLLPGNPTNAQPFESYPGNYLKNNVYYKLAYNRDKGTPVWVAWHLQSEDLGPAPRQDDFRGDAGLPGGWYQVQDNSYSSSGFDRGHNCPSADRTVSVPVNSTTFLMTNIIPQAPNLNQGPWEGLEDYVRNTLVGTNKEAYILMGSFGQGGYNATGLVKTINNGKVTVPATIWKVVMVLDKGDNDLKRLNSKTTILAVNMPNDNRLYTTAAGGKDDWKDYITTVNDLEVQANTAGVPLNMFKNVADSIRPVLKAKLYH